MQVRVSQFDPALILGPADDPDAPGSHRRSEGLHLSRIYRDLEEAAGTANRNQDLSPRELAIYAAVGFLWERQFDKLMADSMRTEDLIRPGEFTRDGIAGSPDLIEQSTWTVVDTKATYRSMNKLDSLEKHFWTWLVQLKGYCHMIDSVQARLVILFLCGSYAPPRPDIRQVDLLFTPRELEENWLMIVTHARRKGWLK